MTDEVVISTDNARLDIAGIHDYISQHSYWAKGRTLQQLHKTIEQSICFGLYVGGRQAGFTRVVTDTVAFAYVLDLFVFEQYRGRGLSRRLIQAMLDHAQLQSVNWMLGTHDAHGLYEKFGFSFIEGSDRYMRRAAKIGV